jgi:hypothetical protein
MSREKDIFNEISEIKKKLSLIDEFRIGTLSKQWNVCGNPSCRCKDKNNPQKHGPYNKLSYTRKGKKGSEFVKEENFESVSNEIAVYKNFKFLTEKWIDLCLELSNLRKSKVK